MEYSGVYNPNRYLLTKHEVNVVFVPRSPFNAFLLDQMHWRKVMHVLPFDALVKSMVFKTRDPTFELHFCQNMLKVVLIRTGLKCKNGLCLLQCVCILIVKLFCISGDSKLTPGNPLTQRLRKLNCIHVLLSVQKKGKSSTNIDTLKLHQQLTKSALENYENFFLAHNLQILLWILRG